MISAIVLAAGQSTRFGQCKQLMSLGGKPLLEHVLDNLSQSKIDDVVVVLGAFADEIQQKVKFGRAHTVFNPEHANGMSTSIQAGLRALPRGIDAAMIVLADQPFVTYSTFDALIEEYRRSRPSVVIPTYNGIRGNPVVVDKSLFNQMMEIRGDMGCRAIFGDHTESIVKIPVDDRGVVSDIDTMADFARESAAEVGDATPDLLETIVDLRRRRQPFAMATVVRAERPTSSKPGDKAIISPDGTLTGWIGGSCAHDIVVRNALEALGEGTPRFLTLSTSLTEPHRHGVIDVPMQCYSGGVLDIFIEPNLPMPNLVIIGNETVAHALARIGQTMQFQITMVTNPSDLQIRGETFIVVATHGRYDEEALEQALLTDASYIALVASPKRAGVILQTLRDKGLDASRIKSPAGLDIGAQGAEEIALSIVAEIVQKRRAAEKAPAEAAAPPLSAIDPICNMTVMIDGARFTSEHEGRRFYFCCAHCQKTFEKEPQRYAHVA